MSTKQKQTEIYIQENMDAIKRSWLVDILERKAGIISAWFDRNNHHNLIILFERNKFSDNKLLNAVKGYGCHAKIVHA